MTLTIIRIYFKLLSIVSPGIAAKKAFSMFQKVRIKKIRDREKSFFDLATAFIIDHHPEKIYGYQMGDVSGEKVFLIHGWDSNPGSMTAIALKLVDEGYNVIAMNLPGHGISKKDHTNMFVVKEALKKFIMYGYTDEPIHFVTHSFGSAVLAYALSELEVKVETMVFLTSPNHIIDIFDEFKQLIGLGRKAYKKLCVMADKVLGEEIVQLNISSKLRQVNYRSILIIHDENDKVIPFTTALQIQANCKNIEIIKYQGVGHYRMLWNEKIISNVVCYLQVTYDGLT